MVFPALFEPEYNQDRCVHLIIHFCALTESNERWWERCGKLSITLSAQHDDLKRRRGFSDVNSDLTALNQLCMITSHRYRVTQLFLYGNHF